MGTKLANLTWRPKWVSYLGCLKGCIDYLGIDVSDAWLFGATGHAFIINMHKVVCPSGPTAWGDGDIQANLGKNIGYTLDGVGGMKSNNDFAEKQRAAWDKIRGALDEGLPCYGWELEIPEYYVIYGYDEQGYYYSGPGCDEGKGPKPWQELGDTGIGWLEVACVNPGRAAGDQEAVKKALEFALEFSESPAKWVRPDYKAGTAGFDTWISALETGTADGFGMAYNAAVWSECRGFAVAFLREARERLGTQTAALFDEALHPYEVLASNLKTVADTFPFHGLKPEHIKDQERLHPALECLKSARDAEALGLKALERLVEAL